MYLDVAVGEDVVVVGENKVGKSNLLSALRLVLDPSLPDSSRMLRFDDFWDGIPRPIAREHCIRVSVDLTDFEGQRANASQLVDYLVRAEPMVARLTYEFGPKADLEREPVSEADYEYRMYGGDDPARRLFPSLRHRLPLIVFPALRDVEDMLASWRRSPLRPLLDDAARRIGRDRLTGLAEEYEELADELAAMPEVQSVRDRMNDLLQSMVGPSHAFPVHLGFAPTDPDRLIRGVRLLIDETERAVGEASLGSANLLFLVLKQLELELAVETGAQDHTFLAIEEPEAHLHPHVQRLVYRSMLQPRAHLRGVALAAEAEAAGDERGERTFVLTTHSPHVVSVSPVRSLMLLRRGQDGASEAVSTAELDLTATEEEDLERYLDVTRGEIVFSRGALLVEGEAELYLLPVLADLLDVDLDELGINVTSVAGTHFSPYAKFLGPDGLAIPFAIVTDADPRPGKSALGPTRAARLLPLLVSPDELEVPEAELDHSNFNDFAAACGVFLNEHTLEVDLFRSGQHEAMMNTLSELTRNKAVRKRAAEWGANPGTLKPRQMLKDIETVGKGRFAQRLAGRLEPGIDPPAYLTNAINFVVGKV